MSPSRSLWSKRSSKSRPSSPSRQAPRRRVLGVQTLEDRCLLSASAGLDLVAAGAAAKPAEAKIGEALANLAEQFAAYQAGTGTVDYAAFTSAFSAGLKTEDSGIFLTGGNVVVDALAVGGVSKLRDDLRRLGATITGTASEQVSAVVPLESVGAMNALTSLSAVKNNAAFTNVGVVTTQGSRSMGIAGFDRFLGLDGAGQMIGVISDSYNALAGAPGNITAGDLPGPGNPNGYTTGVTVVADLAGQTDEGRAMLQIVHDIAPAARLAFATGFSGEAAFAQNIIALRNAGCSVIVDDIGYFTEPFFQDGVIAQAVDTVVAAGATYLSAAGNGARQSYESNWRSGGSYSVGQFTSAPNAPTFFGGRAHDFDPGAATSDFQSFLATGGRTYRIAFQWDQPFEQNGNAGSTNDLDIYILNSSNQVVAGGTRVNIGDSPYEFFTFTAPSSGTYRVMILNYQGSNPGYLKYLWYGAEMGNQAFATNSGTAFGHANSELGISVGAADYRNTPGYGTTTTLESYSSAGGVPILFEDNGTRLSTPLVRNTIDFVAPDNADTSFFSAGYDPDATGFPNFPGTSAAAPHLAAVAALVLQLRPTATPADVYQHLRSATVDMLTAGFDFDSGWGFVRAGDVILNLMGGTAPVTFNGTTNGETMTIRADGLGNTQYLIGANVLFTFPTLMTSTITVDGRGGADTLIVDYVNGNPIPVGGIDFNGVNSSSAALQVTNGAFGAMNTTYTGARSATVTLTPLSFGGGGAIRYNNLTTVLLNPASTQAVTFTMRPVVNPSIILADDAGAQANFSEVRGTGFQTTTFRNPTQYVSVRLSDLGDTIALQDLDLNFAATGTTGFAPVSIFGGGGVDTFNVNTLRRAGNTAYGGAAISGGANNDVFNVNGDTVMSNAALNGDAGTDQFNVNFAAPGATGARIDVAGGTPAGSPTSRDVLNIRDTGGAARNVRFTATAPVSGGTMDFTGLGGVVIGMSSLETANYVGNAADNNDLLQVLSVNDSVNADKMAVYPTGPNAATVTLNKGVAGGAPGPDLNVSGLAQTTGLTLDGNNTPGDILVYSGPKPDSTTATKLIRAGVIDVNYVRMKQVAYGPTAVGGAYAINEGAGVVLNGSGSSVDASAVPATIVQYEWDLDLNGSYDYASATPTLTLDWATLQSFGLDDGTTAYNVQLRATDSNGGFGMSNAVLTINDVAPTLDYTGSSTVGEGMPYTLNLSSFDPGDDTIAQWLINWGDGGGVQVITGNPSTATHAYPAGANNYTITVQATDEDGTYTALTTGGATSKPLGVYVVPATITSLSGPTTAVPGLAVTYTGVFVDPAGTHNATWDWGDGTSDTGVVTEAGGSGNVVRQHAYAAKGTYTVKLTLHETGSPPISRTAQVVVGDAALTPDPLDPAKTTLFVAGSTGNDSILITAGATPGSIDVGFNNRLFGTFTPTGHIIVLGNAGNDSIVIGNMIANPVWAFGGEGDDQITGGIGRAVLVGGGGQDRLIAATADTLLIAGRANIETDLTARNAVMAEWESGSSYTDRMAHLLGELAGGLNGTYYLLAGTTVFDDAARDTLIGNSANDFFFARFSGGVTDVLINRRSDERLIGI